MDHFTGAATNRGLVAAIRAEYMDREKGTGLDERVLAAMECVDRARFIPARYADYAYVNEPVSIGCGQTCSQPSMVALMLGKLRVRPGSRVLEVGAGCGYAAAIVSRLCAPGGQVYACEIIPELALMCSGNLAAFTDAVRALERDASAGLPEFAPYDAILVSAGVNASRFSEAPLVAQLAEGGRLVYPEARGSLFTLAREGGKLRRERYFGVAFVPLVGKNS
ncbi:MAG: protein-L-isoaspartate O-methyltransferase [Spirochaetes bacterium]|nr:protein-L-isoaspartate O-methyltransferase [Spirochaetota bacterium]